MLETCTICDDETGRAGAGDDSLYLDDGTGPYCERCFEIRCLRAEIERLKTELEGVMHRHAKWIKELHAEVERLEKELETWTCRPFFPRGK